MIYLIRTLFSCRYKPYLHKQLDTKLYLNQQYLFVNETVCLQIFGFFVVGFLLKRCRLHKWGKCKKKYVLMNIKRKVSGESRHCQCKLKEQVVTFLIIMIFVMLTYLNEAKSTNNHCTIAFVHARSTGTGVPGKFHVNTSKNYLNSKLFSSKHAYILNPPQFQQNTPPCHYHVFTKQ